MVFRSRNEGNVIILALMISLVFIISCSCSSVVGLESDPLYDTCINCKSSYPYYNYCPGLSRCPIQYTDCLDCFYNATQCVCLLGKTERNCSLLNEVYGRGMLLCVWLPCSGVCAATDKGTLRSCLPDRCPAFPALEIGLIFGLGVPGLLISAFACNKRLDLWTDPKYAVKRRIFHILCSLSSVAANTLFVLFALNNLELAQSNAFIFYSCIGFASLETLAMLLSYFSASCCPTATGEINRRAQLDKCNKQISVNAYYIFYCSFLFCLGLFVDSYFKYSLLEHPIYYQLGAFVRVVPLVVGLLYWLYYVGKQCGVDVGVATNPLLFGKTNTGGYRAV